MHRPETTYQPQEPMLLALQEGRYALAVEAAETATRNAFLTDRTVTPDVAFTNISDTDNYYDCGTITPNDMVALDGLGVDPVAFIRNKPQSTEHGKHLQTLTVADEVFKIYNLGSGFTMTFENEGQESDLSNPQHPEAAAILVAERFKKSPAHREIARINENIKQKNSVPAEIATNEFDPAEDPLGALAFLTDAGLVNDNGSYARFIRDGGSVKDYLQQKLAEVPPSKAIKQDTPEATLLTWNSGAHRQLRINKSTGHFRYSVRTDPAAKYMERPNNTGPETEAIPFVETECAKELCRLVDRAGLMLHPKYQLEMMETGESNRYGSVYTQLSREIAKWVDRPARARLSNLFVPTDPEFYGSALIEGDKARSLGRYRDKISSDEYASATIEEEVRKSWTAIEHSVSSEAAGVLVRMMDEALARDPDAPQQSDLPVTQKQIKFKYGACFDVTDYYIGAASSKQRKDLRLVTVGTTDLLEKTDGAHTFMNTAPLLFNGVALPKGSLFTKQEDGWALIRLTPFAFDEPADRLALDPEVTKSKVYEEENIRYLGGMTMEHLVNGRRY